MFVCSINQQLFSHIVDTVCSSGVFCKGECGTGEGSRVTMGKGAQWLLDESARLGWDFLV